MKLKAETAAAMRSLFDLLSVLIREEPKAASSLQMGARVTFDVLENAIVISAVDVDGHAHPVAAINADPSDRERFGDVGIPVALAPEASETWH